MSVRRYRPLDVARAAGTTAPHPIAGPDSPPPPTPDPASTVAGMRDRVLPSPDQSRYGTATDDPLGRTIYPDGKRFGIPKRACPSCNPRRPLATGHKGDHAP